MVFIGTFGINHKTANLSVREAVSRAAESFRGERAIFFGFPTVLLSTCNRTEIYFSGEDLAKIHQKLLERLRVHLDFSFEHRMYSYFGIDSFAHLAKVTSGLDSAIFAETEIQRQVKLAYQNSKFLSSSLHYVFQKALKVGKNVRSQMHFQNESTLYTTMWRLASWQYKRILVVGYSQINRGLIAYLQHKGVQNITLCTRCPDLVNMATVGRDALANWRDYDVIVCASPSDGFLISGEGKPHQVIFDLSVPRGVDPNTKARIYNIDQLDCLIQQKGSSIYKQNAEEFIWENVVRLTQIYRMKTDRGLHRVGC